MPKNKTNDPITDQEIAFARLILAGTMTDQRAAEAAGLNPATAAYTKAKPRVRAYMLEQRAAMQKQLAEQDNESLRQINLGREQVLARLWQIANLPPEQTRGNIAGQVKALSMIVAIEGLIPNRFNARPNGQESQPATPPANVHIYQPAWLRQAQAEANAAAADPLPSEEAEPPQTPATPTPEDPSPHAQAAPDPAADNRQPAIAVRLGLPKWRWAPGAVSDSATLAAFSNNKPSRPWRR